MELAAPAYTSAVKRTRVGTNKVAPAVNSSEYQASTMQQPAVVQDVATIESGFCHPLPTQSQLA